MSLKFVVFAVFRILLFEFFNTKKEYFFFSEAINMVFLISYLFCLIVFGAFVTLSDPLSLIIVNILMFSLETLYILNSDYSTLLVNLFLFMAMYFFLLGIFCRLKSNYGPKHLLGLFMLQSLTIMCLILILYREDLNKGAITNATINIFLGL